MNIAESFGQYFFDDLLKINLETVLSLFIWNYNFKLIIYNIFPNVSRLCNTLVIFLFECIYFEKSFRCNERRQSLWLCVQSDAVRTANYSCRIEHSITWSYWVEAQLNRVRLQRVTGETLAWVYCWMTDTCHIPPSSANVRFQ